MFYRTLASLTLMLATVSIPAYAEKTPPKVLGWIERVHIPKVNSEYKAKLDTGAKMTSIHADVISIKKGSGKNKKGTVIFAIEDENGEKQTLERKFIRWVHIKAKKGDEGAHIKRPVVRMTFCIGGYKLREDVNLTDRSKFNYPVLIGRNMLAEANIAVDSRNKYIGNGTHPCPTDKPKTK